MWNNRIFLWFSFFSALVANAQMADTTLVAMDTLTMSDKAEFKRNYISNVSVLNPIFDKLYQISQKKDGKLNIVHIGDSHLQADIFSGAIRKLLQNRFGNAGIGLTFPHRLARTNGSELVRFQSNQPWHSHKLTKGCCNKNIGISGFALATHSKYTTLSLRVNQSENAFSRVKLITPNNQAGFSVVANTNTFFSNFSPKKKVTKFQTYTIKKGDAISEIADKFNVSESELLKANGLKSNAIRAGKTLKIPKTTLALVPETPTFQFAPTGISLQKEEHFHSYESEIPLTEIRFQIAENLPNYIINGIVLEKNTPGILYHNIGINGATLMDYNRYPDFFAQTPALEPDVFVISLGTNESFGHISGNEYKRQLDIFVNNCQKHNPDAIFIIMSPPPSLLHRKSLNKYAQDYAQKIEQHAIAQKYAAWDLFDIFGGIYSPHQLYKNGWLAADKVHYTKTGYERQGTLFANAFVESYENYIASKRN